MAARLGLVALGDSVTVGEGNMVCGNPCRSWALWLAEALDLPFTSRAVNGAVTRDVLAQQLPAVRADYDLGCLYAGVNDVRAPGFDPVAFKRDLDPIVSGLAARCARVLVLTLPLDLGRPPAGAKVAGANEIIRAVADDARATVCSLDDLGGWTHVLPDAVHPTALGQLEIADRAAVALGAPLRPSDLAGSPDLGVRGQAGYARTHARLLARDVLRRRMEARGARRAAA